MKNMKNVVEKWLYDKKVPSLFDNLSDEFDDLIHRFPYGDNFGGSLLTNWNKRPAMNVSKTEKEYNIELSVPGISKDDIKIEIDNDTLTVKGKTSKSKEDTDKNKWFSCSEFSCDSFERILKLPEDVDIDNLDNIIAKHENGILKLSIPRVKENRTTKSIKEIKID